LSGYFKGEVYLNSQHLGREPAVFAAVRDLLKSKSGVIQCCKAYRLGFAASNKKSRCYASAFST
jgi:hypothetical protein